MFRVRFLWLGRLILLLVAGVGRDGRRLVGWIGIYDDLLKGRVPDQ